METEQVPVASNEAATVLSLPEGSSMMIHDGEEYVTIVQDGQTYAIPLSEYQNMQPGGTITIQVLWYFMIFYYIFMIWLTFLKYVYTYYLHCEKSNLKLSQKSTTVKYWILQYVVPNKCLEATFCA